MLSALIEMSKRRSFGCGSLCVPALCIRKVQSNRMRSSSVSSAICSFTPSFGLLQVAIAVPAIVVVVIRHQQQCTPSRSRRATGQEQGECECAAHCDTLKVAAAAVQEIKSVDKQQQQQQQIALIKARNGHKELSFSLGGSFCSFGLA